MRVYCKPSQPSCLECWLVGQSGATMLKPPLFQYWTLRNPIDHSISQFSEIDDWGCRILMPGRIKQHDDKYNCNMMKCGMECGVCICLHKKKSSFNIFTKSQVVLLWYCATGGPIRRTHFSHRLELEHKSPGCALLQLWKNWSDVAPSDWISPGNYCAITTHLQFMAQPRHNCCRWHLTGSMKPYYVDIMN